MVIGSTGLKVFGEGERKVSLRNYNGQVGEVMAYVSAINKLNTLGLPVRKPLTWGWGCCGLMVDLGNNAVSNCIRILRKIVSVITLC